MSVEPIKNILNPLIINNEAKEAIKRLKIFGKKFAGTKKKH